MTSAMAQCMASSVGLRMISVSVRQNSTASSRASGARGGFLCCRKCVKAYLRLTHMTYFEA